MLIDLKELIKLSGDDLYIHVPKKKDRTPLLKAMDKLGYHWWGWGKLTDEDYWERYKEQTVYNFDKKYRETFFWEYETCQKLGYKVHEVADIIIKKGE